MFQENKARQIFRKTTIWRVLFSWNTRFEIRPFTLLPTQWYFLRDNTLWKSAQEQVKQYEFVQNVLNLKKIVTEK